MKLNQSQKISAVGKKKQKTYSSGFFMIPSLEDDVSQHRIKTGEGEAQKESELLEPSLSKKGDSPPKQAKIVDFRRS